MEYLFLKKTTNRQTGNRLGFTLIELLIVIAIIGILVSIGIASYASAQRKSRDSKRRGDVKAIQGGWEQYYADNDGFYPGACTVDTTYLPAGLPVDPKTGDSYAVSCAVTTYCFCALLESGVGNADASCNYSAVAKTHYCVSSLQ